MSTIPRDDPSPPPALGLAGPVRVLCQLVGLGLVLVGTYYAIDVFHAIGAVVKDFKNLEGPAATMAEIIDAKHMNLRINGEDFAAGRSAAAGGVFMWYGLWAWIALAIIAAGGRLLYWTFQNPDRKK
jgi:hypothetical protein